jgi:hypothetical protein
MKSTNVPPEWLNDSQLIDCDFPEISNRDAACLILPDLDYDAQLNAIAKLLHRQRSAEESLDQDIKSIEEVARKLSVWRNDRANDERINRIHASIYQDAAHSMAAVGMLAPLIESLFYQAFQGIRHQYKISTNPQSTHKRWEQPAEDQWDCRFVWHKGRRKTSIVEGIIQLAEAVGLASRLPSDLKPKLQALFEYRNKLFHNGFEWPKEERERFATRIAKAATHEGWHTEWFSKAESDGDPWIFYLTDTYISDCLATINRIIEAIGAFVRDEFFGGVRPDPMEGNDTNKS